MHKSYKINGIFGQILIFFCPFSVIPDALVEAGFLGVQGDFNSQGSGMLGSEPQSEVEVAEHQILGRVHSSSGTGGSRTGSSDPESGGTKNGVKLVAILNPFDIRNPKNLRTLKQHYYPEGGWGWVILLVTLCVQIISHGLQIALAMYVMAVPKSSVISRRLLNASFDQSGKKNHLFVLSIFLHYFSIHPDEKKSNSWLLNK